MSLLRVFAIASIVLVAIAVLPQTVPAQSKRMVLIEEATNASCAPCAAQNPTFQAYLQHPDNQGRFIPIIWHAWWPGGDVMYSANVEMNRDRIQYYGVNSVPTSFINGQNETSPIDTASIESHVAADEGMSPITITIDQTQNGSDVSADVTVVSTERLTNATLRIVAVEGFHYYDAAGSNGEKDFYYIARHMLPTNDGTIVNIEANEPLTVPVNFTINPEFNENEMYLVAYVQNETNKEVLQAAQSKPFIVFEGSTAMTHYEKSENVAHTFSRSFTVPADGDYTYTMTEDFPDGWMLSVLANGESWTDEAKTYKEGNVVHIELTITPSESIKRYASLELTVRGPRAASGAMKVTYYNDPIDVLMYVRDEGNPEIAANYSDGFEDAENYNFAIVKPGDEGMFNPLDYSVFAMEVGKSILMQEDVVLLKDYMDNGGRLWLLGAEIAWALADDDATTNDPSIYQDKPFLANYLRAEYVADDPDATTANHSVRGFGGDPIGNNLAFQISGGVRNQNQPDVLKPVNGGVACFYYAKEEDIAGIRFSGDGYAMVYYGFGMEGTTNRGWNRTLYQRTIDWLMSATSVDGPSAAPVEFTVAAYPNPATASTSIPVTLTNAQEISVDVYNVYGQKVATVYEGTAQAGTANHRLDVQALPAGTYMVRVHAGSKVASTMLSVVK